MESYEINLFKYQEAVEQKFSKRNINNKVKFYIQNDSDFILLIDECAIALENYCNGSYYQSKQVRVNQLKERDMKRIALDVMCVTLLIQEPVLFTAVVGMVAEKLSFVDRIEGIKTASEILAIMCEKDCFNIYNESKYEQYYLVSCYELPSQLDKFIKATKYLPPMIVEPNIISNNYDGTHLTEKSSQILGKNNHHNHDICLDHLNRQNQIPLSLNVELLTTFNDKAKDKWEHDTVKQWHKFMRDSYDVYKDLIQLGNRFWITNKYDKRGRCYTQGYHVNPQGNSFRKAMVEFADKEVATR